MSRLHGDDEELTITDAQLVKGMIERGDKNETIAAYFGVNQRAVSHIRSGQKFTSEMAAAAEKLPPPGPYGVDPIYIRFYQTMTKVNLLWEQRRLPAAKELMEKALKNPVFGAELDEMDELLGELMRDEMGVVIK